MNNCRCSWVTNDEIYQNYHDEEWGVPVYDDHTLYEMLILESFHAGLSWLIILKKRDNFRKAFDDFNSEKIEKYDDKKIIKLLNNEGIVRHKQKIMAAIENTKIFHEIQKEFGSFSNYLWGFNNNKIIKNMDDNFQNRTALSDKISKNLKSRGMKFVGSVTIQAYLEAIGIFNNHQLKCYLYKKQG
ncbi:MAG: DNA-3-methyladenine glycosylase I [Spirochaetales bacterium]|nr:DNA-3-methyladenine glycosylase I [Spirochaetales bacterium]